MKKIFTVGVMLLIAQGLFAVNTWEKLFSFRSQDVFRSVREIPTGGYVCAGYISDSTANDSDAFVVKLTTLGDTVWTYRYNSGVGKKDLFYKVVPTTDDGFILCGYVTGIAGTDDALIVKLNSLGHFQWARTWGGNQRDRGQDIIQTYDGNYTLVGYTASPPATYFDAFMFRLSSTGDSLWSRRFGGGPGSYDDANSVRQMTTGEYIMGGQSSNAPFALDQYLVKTDSGGNAIWQKRNGTNFNDNIESIALTADGFILAGTTADSTSDNGYLVRTDTSGNPMWSNSYGDTLPDDFHRVELTSSGDFICSGTTSSIGGLQPNMWLAKISSSGTLLWQKAYGKDNHDHGYSAEETSDGGYILAGFTSSYGFNADEAYVVKTDGNGDILTTDKLIYTTVFTVLSPNSNTCGGPNTPVTIVLNNFSNGPIPNFPTSVQVTGAANTTFNQSFASTTNVWDTVTIGTLNTTNGGTYTFACSTSNGNDVYPKRNSISVTVTIPPFNAPPTITHASKCGSGSLTLGATAASTVYWFTTASGGVSFYNGTSYNTPTLTTSTTYYAQTGLTCPSTRLPVTATINPIPAIPSSNGASRCGPGILTINVTSPDTVSWFNSSSGGSAFTTGLSYTTPSLSTTTTYYIEASNANCTSARVPVVATVSSAANDPVTIPGNRCGPGSVTLIATSPDPINWYDAPTNGTLVGNNDTLITSSISSTTTFYAQADNGCVSNRVSAVATVNPLAPDPVIPNVSRCGPGSVTLTATSGNSISWFSAVTGGTQIGTGNSFTSPAISTTTTYYAEASDGTCPSNRISIQAIINPLPVVSLGNDTSLVSGSNYFLDPGPGFSSYSWTTGASTQTITVTNTDTYCVTVTDANNCSNTECVVVDFSLGVVQNEIPGLNIYPNPTNGFLKIDLPAERNAQLTILNLSGQIVWSGSMNGREKLIDLGSFAKGIYQLNIRSEKAVVNRRIVLE